jgi:hypothetical protein
VQVVREWPACSSCCCSSSSNVVHRLCIGFGVM